MALMESLSRSQFLLEHDSGTTFEAKPQAKPEDLLFGKPVPVRIIDRATPVGRTFIGAKS
jgi:hypothetical protein